MTMQLIDARRHAEHLCDVYPSDPDVEHIGVIGSIRIIRGQWSALVGGHPEYGDRWFPVADLATSCKVTD
jgi:hypothetical protein